MNITVIGGGFYGVNIAVYLAIKYKKANIVIIEKSNALIQRASYNNQARVHNGYHYPRSYTTAYRSRANFPRFILDWNQAINKNFTNIYAIAKNNSKITATQFERFCNSIGVKYENIASNLFNNRLIESSYLTEEFTFNSKIIQEISNELILKYDIKVLFNTEVHEIIGNALNYSVLCTNKNDSLEINSDIIFNCTYSGLNNSGIRLRAKLKHEIAEMALIDVPPELKGYGITVMDGPFFSLMPFPALKLHTLSHVRYTPHTNWLDNLSNNPYQSLDNYNKFTRSDLMIRDASRYLPSLSKSVYVNSLFEVKSVLEKNEADDGRPILFEQYHDMPHVYSILGGKIDNIYDIFEKIDEVLIEKVN